MIKLIKLQLIIGLVLTSIFSCSHKETKNPDSPFYSVPEGSRLHLNTEIMIGENLGRTYFQYGKQLTESELDIYYPHCALTINTITPVTTVVHPTTFTIYKVVDDQLYTQNKVMFSSLSSLHNSYGSSIIANITYYYLDSDDEKDVRTLECLQWNTQNDIEYLSINEVKRSLGRYFTLQLEK